MSFSAYASTPLRYRVETNKNRSKKKEEVCERLKKMLYLLENSFFLSSQNSGGRWMGWGVGGRWGGGGYRQISLTE